MFLLRKIARGTPVGSGAGADGPALKIRRIYPAAPVISESAGNSSDGARGLPRKLNRAQLRREYDRARGSPRRRILADGWIPRCVGIAYRRRDREFRDLSSFMRNPLSRGEDKSPSNPPIRRFRIAFWRSICRAVYLRFDARFYAVCSLKSRMSEKWVRS